MKTLTLISLILGITLISSCNKGEEPKPENKSLVGIWSFTSTNTSGTFTISKITDKEKVNAGNFTVEGVEYTIDTSTSTEDVIALTANEITLYLIDYQVNTSYNEITANQLNFYKPGVVTKIYYETVTCTKQ